MIGSRLRRAGTVAALTLALLATVAVAPAAAAPREAAAESYIDRVTILVSYEGVYRGYIQISVYAAGHRKHLVVCDENGDYAEPTLQVDAGPNQVSYQDPNGSHAGCLEHDIWYGVRKFRVGFHKEGDATHALAWDSWFNRELLRIHGVCGCRSLGPFEVTVDGRPVLLRAGRLRALLAVLAMSAGRAVPVDQIVTALWDPDGPGSGRRATQTYISRIRTALGTVDITAEATG